MVTADPGRCGAGLRDRGAEPRHLGPLPLQAPVLAGPDPLLAARARSRAALTAGPALGHSRRRHDQPVARGRARARRYTVPVRLHALALRAAAPRDAGGAGRRRSAAAGGGADALADGLAFAPEPGRRVAAPVQRRAPHRQEVDAQIAEAVAGVRTVRAFQRERSVVSRFVGGSH